jgi:peptide/nickel transport system substrate-binding protein
MLSASIPDLMDETTASEDTGAYEFEVEGSMSNPPQLVIASLLWYDGDSEFAVTNGQQVDGRYVPVYQAACVSDLQADTCVKWERVGDGFEAKVDIQYGFASAEQHSKTILPEAWNLGSRSLGLMAADAAVIYYNSYRAMKYFESLQEQVGMPLKPVMIDIYDSHLAGCKNDDGSPKLNAFFDYQARFPFGGLGSFLEQTVADGGTVTICTLDSFKSQPDAPINREYHELGHYLQNDMYSPSSNLAAGRGTPHAGYNNGGTNDSFVEGFAEFAALLVAERYNELEAGQPKYPVGTHKYNLEQDYKVWGDIVRMFRLVDGRIVSYYNPERWDGEEFAAAGLLWDLHDSGRESHISHVTSAFDDPTTILSPLSQVYNVTRDSASLFDHHILDNVRTKKPMNLADLYGSFSGDVSRQDLDMLFINHGVFGDVPKRDLVHGIGESVGPTGSAESPERPERSSPHPSLNGSYISAETDARFEVRFSHPEPYSLYDYSYALNMTKGEPAYFGMSPSYYPSTAQFFLVSPTGQISKDSSLTVNSTEYWNYIYSKPEENAIFKTIEISASQEPIVPVSIPDNSTGSTPSQPSGCLIATAAFGSDLAPQVQFLRNFRDNHILSTASGSSFMNVFNAWYYSFSPQVADFEREQPWLQQTVRVAIFPLLGILQIAEKAYAILPGEFGSISAGLVASSLIGSVYLTPLALLIRRVRECRLDFRILLAVAGSTAVAVIASVIAGHPLAMMVTTSILVVSMLVVATLFTSRIISLISRRLRFRI